MSKPGLSCLLATALALPTISMADTQNVNVYGVANVSADVIDTGTSASGVKGARIAKVSSNASRIGLKGSSDINDDLAVTWQVESLIALDNAGGTFATRNSFAGLSSRQYGALLLGRYDTPYKISSRRLDNFSDSIADNRSLIGGVAGASASTAFDGREPDTVFFRTPMLAGLQASIAHANLAETATAATAAKATATSLAVTYESGIVYGSLAYETHHLNTIHPGATEQAWKAGLAYTMNDYSLGAVYEKTSDRLGGATTPASCTALAPGSNCLGHAAWYLTGKHNFDRQAVKLSYTRAGQLGPAANSGARQIAVGYDYHLDKRSMLFVVFTRLSNERAANYGLGNASFSSGATASIGAGSSISALSAGLRHSF